MVQFVLKHSVLKSVNTHVHDDDTNIAKSSFEKVQKAADLMNVCFLHFDFTLLF